ncbi:MAG: HTH merR-type domain-containing protein [Burkholderia sp.]|jgi:DNA-binding transcriptional MerR regulator
MRIGELAQRTGHSVETIRYYEKLGLLPEAKRLDNNYRTYGELHEARLDFIRRCRSLGIGLEEIRSLIESIEANTPDGAERAHALIHRHLQLVEEQMKELRHLKKSLSDLEKSCSGHHDNCVSCGIIRTLSDS